MADQTSLTPCFVCKCTFLGVFSLRFFKSYREIDTVLSDNTVFVTSNNSLSDLRGISQPNFQTEKLPKGLLLFRYVAKMAPVCPSFHTAFFDRLQCAIRVLSVPLILLALSVL